jgi:hypothetical protein
VQAWVSETLILQKVPGGQTPSRETGASQEDASPKQASCHKLLDFQKLTSFPPVSLVALVAFAGGW